MNSRLRMGLVILLAVGLAACAPGTSTSGITVTDAWARTSATIDGAGAAYMILHNGSGEADKLIGAASTAAATVEMHESMEMDGMMSMSPVDSIEVPAGGQAELAPGGLHIMLIGLTQELKAGDKITLTLTFEKAGQVEVTAEVRDE